MQNKAYSFARVTASICQHFNDRFLFDDPNKYKCVSVQYGSEMLKIKFEMELPLWKAMFNSSNVKQVYRFDRAVKSLFVDPISI